MKTNDIDPGSVLHFKFAKMMQQRAPSAVLFKIFSNSPGKKNMAGVAAIHHPLRDIDSRSSNIGSIVDVRDFVDRAAVDAHAEAERGLSQAACNLDCATCRSFRSGKENQNHSVAGRQSHQLVSGLR